MYRCKHVCIYIYMLTACVSGATRGPYSLAAAWTEAAYSIKSTGVIIYIYMCVCVDVWVYIYIYIYVHVYRNISINLLPVFVRRSVHRRRL